MSFNNKITVGDINYYIGEDVPSFSAPKGSVYIFKSVNNDNLLFVNIGNDTWEKCINSEYGRVYYRGRTTGLQTDQDDWVSSHGDITLSSGPNTGNFIMNDIESLEYTGKVAIKAFTTLNTYIVNDSRWMRFESGLSRNFIAPTLYNATTIPVTTQSRVIHTNAIRNVGEGDELVAGIRWTERERGGGPATRTYIPVNLTVEAFVIDRPISFFKEDWESQGFSHNNWTVTNDSTNIWTIGDAENRTEGGLYAVYISNTNGDSASYNEDIANISHIWIDIEIPSTTVDAVLTFDWKCWAENGGGATNWDYGTVNITDSTPVAGTETHTTLATLDSNNDPTGNGRIGAITNIGKFNLNYGGADNNWRSETINLFNYIGQTKKLVFSWINDGSIGNNPPFVLDNINIYIY